MALGARANHCAFYPMSGTTVEAHKDELKAYETSKGTIRFPAGQTAARRPRAEAGQGSDRGVRSLGGRLHEQGAAVEQGEALLLRVLLGLRSRLRGHEREIAAGGYGIGKPPAQERALDPPPTELGQA